MTFEVDALYAEEAYEPAFIEVDTMAMSDMDMLASEEAVPAMVEVDASTNADTETEEAAETAELLETEAEAELDAEAEAEADLDAEAEAETETEEFSFAEEANTPAPATPAPAANATATPAANATIPTNSTTNATFVSANATSQWPTVPNPLDPVCGCYNGASCQEKVCMCPSAWTGQWCERPSALAEARKQEMERLANLTRVVLTVGKQVNDIEAASGSPEAVKRLIAEAARKEIISMNVANAEREFHKALSNNDMFVAKEQLNLIKHMDAEKYPILLREFHVQEERIAKQLGAAAPGIKTMPIPVMQEDKYKDIDVAKAKELKFATFDRAWKMNDNAIARARQFNLDFGDPV